MKIFLGTNQLKYGILNVGQSLTFKDFYINGVKSWKINIPDYLCFTANQANSTVAMKKNGSPASLSLQYSKDGETWNTFTPGTTTVTLTSVGDCVYLRGTNSTISSSTSNYYSFSLTGSVDASGNISSLMDQTLQSTTVPQYCYYKLFQNCTALTTSPSVPAQTLNTYCYSYMFSGCSNLVRAPELPSTALATYCYGYMFQGCSALTSAPELPATTLANYCYQYMFSGCSNITKAPKLSASTLTTSCYRYMFQNCSKLNDIEVSFTTWTSGATTSWVSGVASSGTFHCSGALAQTRGTSNIPTNWTIDATTTTVTIPTLSGTYTFNGSAQNVTVNNFDSSAINQTGTSSATDAGTYTVTWSLKDTGASVWSDGTTTNKSATWTINVKPIPVTITGTGLASGCYAKINDVVYSSAGSTTINLGNSSTIIEFSCYTLGPQYGVATITIDGTVVVKTSGYSAQTLTYNYTVPASVNAINVEFKTGTTSYSRSVNVTTT